jgi:hypothetical protein
MKMLGVDTVAIKNIMGEAMPSAAADETGKNRTLVMATLPEWDSTSLPGEGLASDYSLFFPQSNVNTSTLTLGSAVLEIPFHSDFTATSYSVQSWIKITDSGEHYRAFWNNSNRATGDTMYVDPSDDIRWYKSDNGTNEYITSNSPSALTVDTWYHVVCTFDGTGTSNNGIMYINATAQTAKLSIATQTTNSGGNVLISGRHKAPIQSPSLQNGYNFNGNIAEVCYWNVVLDSTNVTALYNSGDGVGAESVSGSNIVGYWKMAEGSGATVSGSVANEHNATLTYKLNELAT